MSEKDFEISRRKALAGIGVVGVASAGAGLGTTAYFSDQEEFDGNTITAGEFGLSVTPGDAYVDQDGIGPDEGEEAGTAGEGVWMDGEVTIGDAKPGDEYEFCWDVEVENNPGYVVVGASNLTDENGADASGIDVEDLWDINDEADLSTLGDEATANASVGGSNLYSEDQSLADLFHDMEDGLLLENGDACLDPGDTVEFCIEVNISTDVGNEIQGASSSANLLFYAEQCRHNDPENIELPDD